MHLCLEELLQCLGPCTAGLHAILSLCQHHVHEFLKDMILKYIVPVLQQNFPTEAGFVMQVGLL